MSLTNGSKQLQHQDRTFEVCWNNEPNDPEWDDFVFSFPDGHHEQTSLWGQVRARYGWKIARIILKQNGRIIAGTQAQIQRIGRLGNGAYITYGPLINTGDASVVGLFLTEFKACLRGLDVDIAVIGLPYNGHGLVAPLEASGFFRKPTGLQPHFMETTLVIDLEKQLDDILTGMQTSTRKHVRQALKRGIKVIEGEARDLETFRKLMWALCERRNVTPNPPHPDFFEQLWKIFYPRGWIKLFIATYENEPVSAVIAFQFNEWFRAWKIGWSGQFGNFRPNEALWWTMIQYAKKNGCRYFDFVDIDPKQAHDASHGMTVIPSSANTTFFKLGFGGEIKFLPGAYCFFYNPIIRMAMRCGLNKLIDSGPAQQLIQKYTKRRFA